MHIGAGKAESTITWRLVAVVVLFAFSFQSYVIQTHIHQSAATFSTTAVQHRGQSSPAENSPYDCPICQAVSHAGSFFVPDVSALLGAAQFVETATPELLRADASADVNRNWQSRAPPSA